MTESTNSPTPKHVVLSGWIFGGADRVGRSGLGFLPIIGFLVVGLFLSRWVPFPIVVALAAIALFLTRSRKTTAVDDDLEGPEPDEAEEP